MPLRQGIGARAVVLVGHVTKGGGIAGPKTLEHIVTPCCTSRAKRHSITGFSAPEEPFGSVDEIGVFRMTGTGLEPVANPAAAFWPVAARRIGTAFHQR